MLIMHSGKGSVVDGSKVEVHWAGTIVSVQPRIRLLRSFDQRSHQYVGYSLFLKGTVGEESAEISVGIGKAAQAKHCFQVGDVASGTSIEVADEKKEVVRFYKTRGLKILSRASLKTKPSPPPWTGAPPSLERYRERGHRRLQGRTYASRCRACIWGCRMPVEMIIDQWNPSEKRYRFETFCYGPKSCAFYKASARRKVPGRKGMMWEEPDWVDEEATAHRDADE